MLPEIDIGGQQKLKNSCALIVGLGGLGSSSAIYLAAAGVGELILVDFDKVEISNLQRQIVHTTEDIGRLKTDSARSHLLALNPEVKITTINQKVEHGNLHEQVKSATVVLDCSDNFTTRFAINDMCVEHQTPLVSAAAIRFEAQISVFNHDVEHSPCYRCLYNSELQTQETCTENGVISPLLGIVGSIQACETMKIIIGIGNTLVGRLLLFDAMNTEWHTAQLNKDLQCPMCSHKAITEGN